MDLVQVICAAASLLCTIVVGALAYFFKKTLDSLEKTDQKNAAAVRELEDKHDREMKDVQKQITDLKADLPLVYVTREDYIRVMTRVEDKLDQLLYGGRMRKEE